MRLRGIQNFTQWTMMIVVQDHFAATRYPYPFLVTHVKNGNLNSSPNVYKVIYLSWQ